MLQQWHDFLITQGASLSESNSICFGDYLQNIEASSTQNCMMSLSNYGLLSISGPDAKSFLQGQVTCNVDLLSKNNSLLGAHCNIKGRMQSLFRISLHPEDQKEDHFILSMPLSMLDIALQNFKKFAIFSKVDIKIVDDMVGIGLVGPNTSEILSTHQQNISVRKLEGVVPRYEVFGYLAVMKDLWEQWRLTCKPLATEIAELLDIRAGIPMIYPATVGEILPHHANLSLLQGISYDKGCYLGQEIIARMQYRGKLKKHMYRAFVQDEKKPPVGTHVVSGAPSPNEAPGITVRVCESKTQGFELLIILDEQHQNFENVRLYSADGPKVLHLDLPYSFSK